MKSNLIGAITERMPTLSKGQKRIARFILEHYDSAAFMTANKLGREVQVSESTVVRFATELGYDGYPRLQKAMQELVRSKLTSLAAYGDHPLPYAGRRGAGQHHGLRYCQCPPDAG